MDKVPENIFDESLQHKISKKMVHPALKLKYILHDHTGAVYRMALSPDGQFLASPSEDGTVKISNVETGKVLKTFRHGVPVTCVSWSPIGDTLATGSKTINKVVQLWDIESSRRYQYFKENNIRVNDIAWSPHEKLIAVCSDIPIIRILDVARDSEFISKHGHTDSVECLAWSPDGKLLSSGSADMTVKLWSIGETHEKVTLKGATSKVRCLSWSPDGRFIAAGTDDSTVHIWDVGKKFQTYMLEGHTQYIISLSYLDDGFLLASLSINGTLIIWRTDSWAEVLHIDYFCDPGILANIVFHPKLPLMISRNRNQINIWTLDLDLLRSGSAVTSTLFYVNAKAVLLGDSGVGKSGLGIRIAEGEYRITDSTHGAQFWHITTEQFNLPENVKAELTLWDLAGQPEYRLTHQLFLDDTDIALLLFDCSDASDPFHGVPYWAKVLKKHLPEYAKKFLISSRCDVSPVTVDRNEINCMLADYSLNEYFKTSAKSGEGVEILFQQLLKEIPWNKLPRTSTPQLFHIVREILLECKAHGKTLLSMDEIRRKTAEKFTKRDPSQEEINTVIRLLQSRGLVYHLKPKPNLSLILLRPELVNQYGSSIIQSARNHKDGIGAVLERDVLVGNLTFSGFDRLPQNEESLVLEATTELLIRHDLCFREMGYLVFPSQINVNKHPPSDTHSHTEVAYRFSGSIETIYASLVVRLSYTNYFHREDQWKYTVEFSREGERLGFSMRQIEEGTGELEIYFDPGVNEFDRVTFVRFITDHLRTKGIDIEEEIRLYCPKCSKEVSNREAIDVRIESGFLDIPCQYCTSTIIIPKSIEDRYRRDPSLSEKQQQLVETVKKRTTEELSQFRVDQQQYIHSDDHTIRILHLSDFHISDVQLKKGQKMSAAQIADLYRVQLEMDLEKELEVKRLDYLVITGDIADKSIEDEYRAAFTMIDNLVKHFGLDPSRVVVVPGNHDINFSLSKKSYPFVYSDDIPQPLPEGQFIQAGDAGVLLRDEKLYQSRFTNFSNHFYRHIYSGQEYPLDYSDQVQFIERPEDRILFLGLNSCWQIDHSFHDRASIFMPALTNALDRMRDHAYDGWLKIVVWHHPITGKEMMKNDEFMQLIAQQGFQICLHGHIHEAIEDFHRYDKKRSIHIVGAGTFGSTKNLVSGIPYQYNLLKFDNKLSEMTVHTRKKEKVNGSWSADARWGDKNKPVPEYSFKVEKYKSLNCH